MIIITGTSMRRDGHPSRRRNPLYIYLNELELGSVGEFNSRAG